MTFKRIGLVLLALLVLLLNGLSVLAIEDVWTEPVTGMKFVRVPGNKVSNLLNKDFKSTLNTFWLGQTEVTQGQWKKVMGNNPSGFLGNNRPVERVSLLDIQVFIEKLNVRHNGKYKFRLPTETEWEYACREGGKKVEFCNGKNTANKSEINYGGSETKPVASYPANSLGLFDMSGNVWEWTCTGAFRGDWEKCAFVCDKKYFCTELPPSHPCPKSKFRLPSRIYCKADTDIDFIICGASWIIDDKTSSDIDSQIAGAGWLNSECIIGIYLTDRSDDLGFRLARD